MSSAHVNCAFDDATLQTDLSAINDHNLSIIAFSKKATAVENPQLFNERNAHNKSIFRRLLNRGKWKTRETCTIGLLKNRLPFLQWAPTYTLGFLFSDFLAGFTVALTAIPQGIAYGAVAGVPVEYGLYTAFAGPIVYALLGSVSQVTVGPTAVMALMANEYVQKGGVQYAVVLSFLAGCFELLAGILNLGFLVDFISGPVISGFCSAAATTVIFSQIKTILGLKFRGSSFTKVITGIVSSITLINFWDTLLGLLFIIFISLLKNVTSLKNVFKTAKCLKNKYIEKTMWYIGTCRNAIALLLGCLLAYLLEVYAYQPFSLTGDIKSGIPSLHVPPFTFERVVQTVNQSHLYGNSSDTESETVSFLTIFQDIGTGLVLVPVIAILEQVAIAKAFCKDSRLDSTQEMLALGSGSIFCSFFGSFPLTASFARSSVLSASGGKTQLASFFNGSVVLLALAFLMPTFYYIPKAVLGAVIVTAVFPMVEYHELFALWKSRKIELIPFLMTYLCCLLISLEMGILIGIEVHLLLVVYEASRTKIVLSRLDEDVEDETVMIIIDRSLYFPSVERLRDALNAASDNVKLGKKFLVIDMMKVVDIDHTNLKVLVAKLTAMDKAGIDYRIVNLNKRVWTALLSVLPESALQKIEGQ